MRARVNPFCEPGFRPPAPNPEVQAFHRSLPEYAATPLHDLAELARTLGLGSLYVKDESWRFGLNAFKGLGASWALHRIRAQRNGPMTVATATEGNHGRAVAWAARQLGLEAVIFIRASAAPARIEKLRKAGATVELVEGSYDDAVRRCAVESAAHDWQVVSDTGYPGYLEIPGWIAEGYVTLFEEVREQLEAAALPRPDVVLIQAGVGGLLHAGVAHFRAAPIPPILVAVEPVAADALTSSIEAPAGEPTAARGSLDSIMAGLNCGQVSLTAWPVVRRGVELFVTVTDPFAEAAMRQLAQSRGADAPLIAGESGAAGLAGLLAILAAPELAAARDFLRLGPASRVLLINTEGATDPAGYRRVVPR
ncbi:MAG TPA: diaminopropionate ammonia-lyase [Gemmatimonadales bacterium]|jgi:diaminopropionate ammonia-lyase|nr:diaminopropionate ammonia-lyase [Gemmatimonadales bacterium]